MEADRAAIDFVGSKELRGETGLVGGVGKSLHLYGHAIVILIRAA